MVNKKILALLGGLALVAAEAISVSAEAQELRVRCERRGARRSRVSVDGTNLPAGTYSIVVTSGANSAGATETIVAPADEFEADFDSNRADILAGATPIARTFIQNGKVSVEVTGPENLSATDVACRIR